MQEPKNWREFLAAVIRETKEKQRIATEMGIDPVTLTRWANHESSPRPRSLLNRLIDALPNHRKQLSELIRMEFPDAIDDDPASIFIDPIVKEVPSVLYARILEAYATVAENLRTWTIINLVMQQLIRQLDPEQSGIAAVVAQCRPPLPNETHVRSLYEFFVERSPALKSIGQRGSFLGSESLVGSVVSSCQPMIIQDVQLEPNHLIIHRGTEAQSAAAYPLQKAGKVAGCLLLVSIQKDFFSRARQALVQNYAHLLSLAFRENEFYSPTAIELKLMPAIEIQDSYLRTFNQRVNAILSKAERTGQVLTRQQAEEQVIAAFLSDGS